jgi:prepilin-type N-terminal cleavage/methylation domain-containing protein
MKNKSNRGFTMVEMMIVLAIMAMFVFVASSFQKDVFSLNTTLQSSLNAQLDARHLVKVMVTELRKASPSSLGTYPIEAASSTAITFYSDVDNNGVVDKVRYYLTGNTIRKSVTVPTGSPLTYNPANEVLSTIINNIVSSSTLPIFQYYSSNYAGTTSPLTYPLDIQAVRLVKITVIIDNDPNRSPVPIVVTSSVSMRNLKDNL